MYGNFKTLIIAILTTFGAISLLVLQAGAQERFGSIYFSQKTGTHGYSYDYGSQNEATESALRECRADGVRDCTQSTWFKNACGALAVGDGNGWGSHWGVDRDDAEFNALTTCQKYAKNCAIVRWVCTTPN